MVVFCCGVSTQKVLLLAGCHGTVFLAVFWEAFSSSSHALALFGILVLSGHLRHALLWAWICCGSCLFLFDLSNTPGLSFVPPFVPSTDSNNLLFSVSLPLFFLPSKIPPYRD